MAHFPRFVYTNDAAVVVDFTLTLSCDAWVPGSQGVGGREFSAARMPASYEVRRDHTLSVTLRFTEAEWASVRKMLEHGGRGTLVTLHLDGTSRPCYLLEPDMDQEILPSRSQYPGDLEISTRWVDNSDVGWDAVRVYG